MVTLIAVSCINIQFFTRNEEDKHGSKSVNNEDVIDLIFNLGLLA